MKQTSLDLNLSTRRTRKHEFLAQMQLVVPWAALVELIAPYYPEGKNGRPPFALETMLRVHFLQQWFSLSDPAMEEAFFDTPLYREFAQLDAHGRLPDESTILRFRHRLEKHKLAELILATVNDLLTAKGLLLKAGTAVDATLIAAPSSTKNKDRARDPEMHSSQKGKQWYFGMKAHIGVDADSGRCTPCAVPRATWPTSLKATACCMVKRVMSTVMLATRVLTRELMLKRESLGMWRCAQASAKRWTRKTIVSMP